MASTDTVFAGSIPANYDRYLGPLLFQPYAEVAAQRARALHPQRILETAAGTGIVTQALARELPDAEIVATDLNQAMLDVAAQRVASRKVSFQAADAHSLPFHHQEFDLVISQFGSMFFPDRVTAYREARRVLRPGGSFINIVWDSLERNPASKRIHDAIASQFPDNPPRFLERTPFGYSDPEQIERDHRSAGFTRVDIERVQRSSRVSADAAAIGLCQGSPLRLEIEERDAGRLEAATEAAAEALREHDGREVEMSALVITASS
jgi:ubiquinone/menaquinone biosynthesis C-methylase UbiE